MNLITEVMEKDNETDLIVFPELITSGYECGSEFQNLKVIDNKIFQVVVLN